MTIDVEPKKKKILKSKIIPSRYLSTGSKKNLAVDPQPSTTQSAAVKRFNPPETSASSAPTQKPTHSYTVPSIKPKNSISAPRISSTNETAPTIAVVKPECDDITSRLQKAQHQVTALSNQTVQFQRLMDSIGQQDNDELSIRVLQARYLRVQLERAAEMQALNKDVEELKECLKTEEDRLSHAEEKVSEQRHALQMEQLLDQHTKSMTELNEKYKMFWEQEWQGFLRQISCSSAHQQLALNEAQDEAEVDLRQLVCGVLDVMDGSDPAIKVRRQAVLDQLIIQNQFESMFEELCGPC